MATSANEPLVLSSVKNRIATVTLNRPKALNALNTEMIEGLAALYTPWSKSSEVAAVVLTGAGGRALCAGGDVKTVVESIVRGEGPGPGLHFFVLEYVVDHLISVFPVPHVAILDGITFGGGVGLSVHGAFQVATERSLFAMPECAIGLYPDVGGSHFLPRLPGGIGYYLGLTGARIRGADLVRAGVASHYVSSARLPALLEGLHALGGRAASHEAVYFLLDRFQAESGGLAPGTLDGERGRIAAVFKDASSVEEVHERLAKDDSEWGERTRKAIAEGSPLSQKITFEQIRRGSSLTLAECLTMEHGMMSHILSDKHSDFVVGVTAKLIERSKEPPKWRHARVQDVTDAEVQAVFAPLAPENVLRLDATPARL